MYSASLRAKPDCDLHIPYSPTLEQYVRATRLLQSHKGVPEMQYHSESDDRARNVLHDVFFDAITLVLVIPKKSQELNPLRSSIACFEKEHSLSSKVASQSLSIAARRTRRNTRKYRALDVDLSNSLSADSGSRKIKQALRASGYLDTCCRASAFSAKNRVRERCLLKCLLAGSS